MDKSDIAITSVRGQKYAGEALNKILDSPDVDKIFESEINLTLDVKTCLVIAASLCRDVQIMIKHKKNTTISESILEFVDKLLEVTVPEEIKTEIRGF